MKHYQPYSNVSDKSSYITKVSIRHLGVHKYLIKYNKMRGNLDLPKSGALNLGLNLAEGLHDGRHSRETKLQIT